MRTKDGIHMGAIAQGIVNLVNAGASFHVAAMSADSRIVSERERQSLLDRLSSIDRALADYIEEEVVDAYPTTLERLRYAGVEIPWPKGARR